MNCRRADLLMIKYLNNGLSPDELELLKEHTDECRLCREAFREYNELLLPPQEEKGTSSDDGRDYIPEGFEGSVMARLEKLGCFYEKKRCINENILYSIWGVFSVLCGLNMFIMLNYDRIVNYFYRNPLLREYADYFVSADVYISRFKNAADDFFCSLMVFFGSLGENIMKPAVFAAFLMLFAAHILSLRGDLAKAAN